MGIQWSEIKKQTPKAFKKLKKWINAETKGILQFELMMILKNERELFDFFDDMGIYIYLDPCACHNPPLWNWCILQNEREIFIAHKEHKKRTIAETASFKKSFKILEKLCK